MPGTPLLTITGSLAAFALGFQLFRDDGPSPAKPQSITLSQAPSATTPPVTTATPSQESPEPPLSLDLVSEVEFTQFDAELNLTPEARLLLGINEDQAKAVSNATHKFRDAIELAQSLTAKARHEDPMSKEEKLFVEVDPLGSQATTLINTFRSQIQQALGTERADLISTPVEISPNQTFLYGRANPIPPPSNLSGFSPEQLARYKRSSSKSADRFHEIKLIQSDGNIFSYHSSTVKRVPNYVTEFFAMQEEAE